jgi:hypothetical protein
LDPDLEA